MDQTILREVGHRLYQTERLKEMKRYLVFRARCRMHEKDINGLLDFLPKHRNGRRYCMARRPLWNRRPALFL